MGGGRFGIGSLPPYYIIALPPPPRPPFDIEAMDPLDVPPQRGWSDEIEPSPEDWWRGENDVWQAPEIPLDDGQVLILDADDPFPSDEWAVYRTD